MSAMFSPGLGSWFGPDDHAAESDDGSPPLDLVPPNANGLLHVDDPVSDSDDNMLPIFGHPLDPLRTPQPGTSRQCRRAPLRGPPRDDRVYDFPDENTPICQNILEAAPPKLTRKVHAKRRRPKKPTSSNKAVRQPYAARPRRNILSSVKVRQSCRLLPMAPLLIAQRPLCHDRTPTFPHTAPINYPGGQTGKLTRLSPHRLCGSQIFCRSAYWRRRPRLYGTLRNCAQSARRCARNAQQLQL